jgi:hypothetical protein
VVNPAAHDSTRTQANASVSALNLAEASPSHGAGRRELGAGLSPSRTLCVRAESQSTTTTRRRRSRRTNGRYLRRRSAAGREDRSRSDTHRVLSTGRARTRSAAIQITQSPKRAAHGILHAVRGSAACSVRIEPLRRLRVLSSSIMGGPSGQRHGTTLAPPAARIAVALTHRPGAHESA